MTVSLVVDTDGACDDALAIWLAASSGQVGLSLITTVAGAVPVQQATANVLSLLDMLDLGAVPVYAGAEQPLARELENSEDFLGPNGMSGVVLDPASRSATGWSAAEALVAAAGELQGRRSALVALGPLTNIAAALELDPDLLTRFERVVVMGTATDGVGNITAEAEYNTWVDPEAAAAVFAALGHTTVVGWQACRTSSLIDPALHQRIVDRPSEYGDFLLRTTAALRQSSLDLGSESYDLADVLAMAVVVNPDLIEHTASGRIVLDPDVRGRTILQAADGHDDGGDGRRSATVVESADRAGYTKMIEGLAISGTGE